MGGGNTAARREGDLVRRCYAGLDGPAFQAGVMRSIHALLPVDAVFFATADPATLGWLLIHASRLNSSVAHVLTGQRGAPTPPARPGLLD